MALKLFVGNLPYSATDSDLSNHFSRIGAVREAKIVINKMDGRPRGIGFVTMSTEDDATRAIVELNNSDLGGRRIVVSEAHERPRDSSRPPFRREASAPRTGFGSPSLPPAPSHGWETQSAPPPPRRTYTPPPTEWIDAPPPANTSRRRQFNNDRRRRSEESDW